VLNASEPTDSTGLKSGDIVVAVVRHDQRVIKALMMRWVISLTATGQAHTNAGTAVFAPTIRAWRGRVQAPFERSERDRRGPHPLRLICKPVSEGYLG
jgi:hypothetical protein